MGQIMHTTHYSSFPLRKTLLALAIGAASQTAMAADAAAAKQPGEETLIAYFILFINVFLIRKLM